jgi:GTPase SAR1 family protein
MKNGSTHHRIHTGLTFVVAFVAGICLIPLLRVEPKPIHKFMAGFTDWQRTGFILILCVLYAHTMFKLFSPRLVHLRYLGTHPPTWFGWLLGIAVVGVIDVSFGLTGYQGTWREWLGYGAGSIGLVALYRHLSKSRSDEWELKPIQQWIHAVVGFLTTVIAGVILIPLIRDEPQTIHEIAAKLDDWFRIGLTFLLCLFVSYLVFSLLSPRFADAGRIFSHPPVWVAVLLGVLVVALIDVLVGLNPDGYQGDGWDWLGCGAGSIALVALIHYLRTPKADEDATEIDAELRLQVIENADWDDIEAWLFSSTPGEYDFLGNRVVARRLSTLLAAGTRSIGIIGPFGAGKTSIVEWFKDEINSRGDDETTLFFSSHSCWGFENSASSIHEMLAQAIGVVEAEIDTFHVSSLPESYRQTFSAGGNWIDKISNLILERRPPSEQFQSLSELLGDLNAKLVIVVEDLDRNNSRTFDIQEVLAFLQQLNEYDNLTFILTGGLSSSSKIDYAKLCDHIEFLRSIETYQSSALLTRVCERCLDTSAFPHVPLGEPYGEHIWNPLTGMLMRDYEELSLPQAIASLLSTPRSLRHALARTFHSWRTLCGEIDLNDLVAANVLRFGAAEAFLFLVRRWDRLHAPPSHSPSFGKDRIEKIKEAIVDDWNKTIADVEWNPTAAMMVIVHLLPAAEDWFGNRSGGSMKSAQSVDQERYWRRTVNESLDDEEVRDQEVIRDLKEWYASQSEDSPLVERICASEQYSRTWKSLGHVFLANQPDLTLLLCKQVIERACRTEGAAASGGSQGVESVRAFTQSYAIRNENQAWLKDRITDSAAISLRMATDLWRKWGTGASIVLAEDQPAIRRHLVETVQNRIVDSDSLVRLLDPKFPYVLYQIVFDFGENKSPAKEVANEWKWLSPMLLDALRKGSSSVASAVSVLIATRTAGSRQEPWTVDPDIFFEFFGDDAEEVVDLLSKLAGDAEAERDLVEAIVRSARAALASGTASSDEGETTESAADESHVNGDSSSAER